MCIVHTQTHKHTQNKNENRQTHTHTHTYLQKTIQLIDEILIKRIYKKKKLSITLFNQVQIIKYFVFISKKKMVRKNRNKNLQQLPTINIVGKSSRTTEATAAATTTTNISK